MLHALLHAELMQGQLVDLGTSIPFFMFQTYPFSRLLPVFNRFANPGCGVGEELQAPLRLSGLETHVDAQQTKSALVAPGNNPAATTHMPSSLTYAMERAVLLNASALVSSRLPIRGVERERW